MRLIRTIIHTIAAILAAMFLATTLWELISTGDLFLEARPAPEKLPAREAGALILILLIVTASTVLAAFDDHKS